MTWVSKAISEGYTSGSEDEGHGLAVGGAKGLGSLILGVGIWDEI